MGQKKAGAVCPGRRENCMRIIGIVPGAKLFGSEDLYADQYLFVNGYPKRILANGGTPVGILSSDGYAAEDSLSLCDAFVFCGGARFYPYHFQVMEYAAKSGKPVLGICLGEQILGRRSEETGGVDLLGLIDADVRALRADGLPLPHMGWNRVYPEDTPHARLLFRGIEAGDWFYFVHSYAMPTGACTTARCTYGEEFTAAAAHENFMGVQFHPERSGRAGARLIANFLGIEA